MIIMEETIFFNRGNALTSDVDQEELMKKVQIEKDKRGLNNKLVVVQDNRGEYLLFDFSDADSENDRSSEFQVKQIIEDDKVE
ncbi:putative uncharacterized protein [Tetragenococcus halophilus subsp. halophilus]|uniref:Uncharacterized protein n=2 Tax=Tetragenococcus halophilus TaxID=51669 RepID=A0AAN1VRT0_TETHN|nr:hypothetical protein TEH_12940 [Tetragenococcus halophilus NBRC 12172]GBD58962.1 putative uncharacterized protein [Tetragenococcus halophilus subsp. halophilus]GBD62230.1 putative uncharacterized protein [Tetragenococcus halophilus subsp. halophilus]GBD69464.1 putative uncharacterized protein [Tetragenococcus halophilus subsp. halophilus]GBD72720.1 putative uncharacterized protein [Tetragenococcus halophilus subsp. halophilus]